MLMQAVAWHDDVVCVCACVQVSAEGRVSLNELINLELGGKQGIVELQVRARHTLTRHT